MYFKLRCETPEDDDGGYAEIHGVSVPGVDSWITGRPLSATITEVIHCDVEPEDDYDGPIIEMYAGKVFLMSERLANALKDAGVDNLELFPAILKNVESGEQHRYFAVNIIGVVAAADLDSSQWESFDGDAKIDTFFNKLVIDEDKSHRLLLFRLAESLSTVVIHERVKNHLLKSGIDTLTFIPAS